MRFAHWCGLPAVALLAAFRALPDSPFRARAAEVARQAQAHVPPAHVPDTITIRFVTGRSGAETRMIGVSFAANAIP
jgi:hypothetical protein